MASLSYNRTGLCLFLTLLVTSYLRTCSGIFRINSYITTDENTTRPETTTPQGTIRGINIVTHHNRTVSGFLGIPYAKPPVGNLRFATKLNSLSSSTSFNVIISSGSRFVAPVAADGWNETLDASGDTDPCPQFNDDGEFSGNEDCLHLNVFTPQRPASNDSMLLPVMVYVMGGGFKTVNNSLLRFGPYFLLDKDVLLVVPNFRVGVLGFFSTGDEVAPGNNGLKDIVRSLKWVQENIQYFGGDPNQVTLFGGSSGAMSVHLLALSNSTNGLFQRYITLSGSALIFDFAQPRAAYAKRAAKLGEYLGCPTNTSILLINCLRGLNASQLFDANSLFYVWETLPQNVWLPTSEPDIEGAFLTDTPTKLMTSGKIRDLPWVSGVLKDEGLGTTMQYYEDPDLFESLLDNLDLVLPIIVGYENVVDNVTAFTAALKEYYLNDLTANRRILLNNLTVLIGDARFNYPAYNSFQQQLLFAESIQYFCSFEYRGTFSHTYFHSGSTNYTGVAHGDEILYLFENRDFRFGPSDYEYTDADRKMIDTMVQLWTSFAINGVPTTVDSNSTLWEQYSSRNNYLRIGNGSDLALEMKHDLLKERMEFWVKLNAGTSGGSRNLLQIMPLVLCICLLLRVNLF